MIPVRSADRIRAELEVAKATEREADARISETSSQRAQTKALAEVKKQESNTVGARIKAADKEKNEAEKTANEAERKVIDTQRQFLQRREDLHAAEYDQAKAMKKFAVTSQRALQMELELAARRDGRARVAGDPTAVVREDAVVRELERKTLEAQRERADAAKDVASRGAGHRQAPAGPLSGASGRERRRSEVGTPRLSSRGQLLKGACFAHAPFACCITWHAAPQSHGTTDIA